MKYLIVLFLSFNTSIFAQQNIDLFIWAGQSNALGMQGDAAQYPADPDNLDGQIQFNWTVPNGSSSNGWTTMGPQDLGHYFPSGHFGPEVTFSRKMIQAGYNAAIFKYTQGGTSIYEDWLHPGEGGLYDQMISALNTAITELENLGYTVNIKGFIWIQGESDSNSDAAANAYYNNLSGLINDLRNNVLHLSNLPVILGVDEQYFNLAGHERHQILNAHQDIAMNDATIKFTSMYPYPKADVTHLTPAGLVMHGEDLFDSFQVLVSGQYPSDNCFLSSVGDHTTSFERAAWGQSFTTDCSGTLSSLSFEALSQLNSSATFTLYNGADCSSSVLITKSLSAIEVGDNTIDLIDESLYLDKEHTYYFDVVSDNGATWKINFRDDNVFGVLRCTADNDVAANCGRTFLNYDMGFSVKIAESNCVDITNLYSFNYNGKTYEIIKDPKNWENAAACAVERGGKLARINDADEQAAVWTELNNANIDLSTTIASNGGGASYVWIGGNDLAAEGTWIWDGANEGFGDQFWNGDANGNVVGGLYSNWGQEPDNAGNQDCLGIALTQWPINSGSLGSAGQWNDLKADNLLCYIIEYPTILEVNELAEEIISIYPNPVKDILFISNRSRINNVLILNSSGQIINNIKVNSQNEPVHINFSKIKTGIYFINIFFENGKSVVKKVVK